MRERIITAICILAIVLPVVFFGGFMFYIALVAVAMIATAEMVKMRQTRNRAAFWVKFLTFVGVLIMIELPTLSGAFMWNNFIFATLLLANFIGIRKGKADISFYVVVIFYLGMSFRSLHQIRVHSLALFIFLITTVILTDSAAYFVGRFLGKKKLAPKISPNKTVEGAVGGWLIGGAFALIFGLVANLFDQLWILIILAIGLPVLSQIGDLIASAFKRQYGIKDYGKIFPGHGGVMDRLDSQLLAGILIYAMLLLGGVL